MDIREIDPVKGSEPYLSWKDQSKSRTLEEEKKIYFWSYEYTFN